jgi:hypothetical protein
MTTALVLFFVDLAIFTVALRLLKRSTLALAAVMPLLVYFVTLGTVWAKPDAWALPIAIWAAACATVVLPGDGLSRLTDALGRYRLLLYLLSTIAVAGLVFIILPVGTFRTSPGELSVHLDYLVTVNGRQAMTIIYVAALLYALAPTSRMRTALTLLALGTLALAVVYAYALPFGYPAMSGLGFEGDTLSSTAQAVRLLGDAIVIVAVALTVRAVVVRYGMRPLLLTVILVTVSMFGTAAIDVRNEVVGGEGGAGAADATSDRPIRFSQARPNVLVIFLDRFMGSYVESALARRPQLATELSGFTWYPRTVAAGANSIVGVNPMFGGYDYTPDEINARGGSLRDKSVEAYSILPYNFSKKGYRANVLNPRGLGFTMKGDCSFLDMPGVYCGHIPAAVTRRAAAAMDFELGNLSRSNYTDLLVLLGSMRAAPYGLKETVRNHGTWRPFLDHSAATTFAQWAELRALPGLTDTNAPESNYNVVSNILPHEPVYLGESCTPLPKQFAVSGIELRRRGHMNLTSLQHQNAAECSLIIVAEYLRHLQEAGVYDNTTVVLVSDHGVAAPDVKDRSARAVAGGTDTNLYVRSRSLLMVKRRGATGPLQTSEEFLPNAEVPRIVCEDIGGCVNPYLDNKPIAVLGRNDPWIVSFVPWQFTAQRPDAFDINQQYELTGKDPFDVNGWKEKRRSR